LQGAQTAADIKPISADLDANVGLLVVDAVDVNVGREKDVIHLYVLVRFQKSPRNQPARLRGGCAVVRISGILVRIRDCLRQASRFKMEYCAWELVMSEERICAAAKKWDFVPCAHALLEHLRGVAMRRIRRGELNEVLDHL